MGRTISSPLTEPSIVICTTAARSRSAPPVVPPDTCTGPLAVAEAAASRLPAMSVRPPPEYETGRASLGTAACSSISIAVVADDV